MKKTDKIAVFKTEINYVRDNALREDLKVLIGLLPD